MTVFAGKLAFKVMFFFDSYKLTFTVANIRNKNVSFFNDLFYIAATFYNNFIVNESRKIIYDTAISKNNSIMFLILHSISII